MESQTPNNQDHPVTKAELDKALAATKGDLDAALAATTGELKEVFTTNKEEMEQLLAAQANLILEAVDERLDKKLDEKFNTVITKLDGVMKEAQAHREEDVFGAEQLHRHDDQLDNHEKRIKALELHSQR